MAYIELESSGFTPEEFADVKQCIETLCSIQAGSQPLDRDLGIDFDGVVGYPMNVASNMLSLEIIEKIRKYEPRVEVESVDVKIGADGQLIPHVHIVKSEEEEE